MSNNAVVNARLVDVWDAFVDAAREIVREKNITEDELHAASQFMQRLSAEGFLVGVVDMMLATAASENQASMENVHKANLEGPLYREGAPIRKDGVLYEGEPSERAKLLTVTGRVFDSETGAPISGAELDFWQADQDGLYDLQGFNLRGIVLSDDEGRYDLHTIVPEAYTTHEDDLVADLFGMMGRHAYRSAHIHLKVRVGGEHVLTTQFFDSGSRFLDTDVVIGAVRDDVMMERIEIDTPDGERARHTGTFDIPVTRVKATA